jgi:hypothetical protein
MSTHEQLTLIRHAIHYRELRYADKEREMTDALIALYADAERFKALERAHDVGKNGPACWCWVYDEGNAFSADSRTLAELADGLRSETK